MELTKKFDNSSLNNPIDKVLTSADEIVDLKATTEKLLTDSLKNTEGLIKMFTEQLSVTTDEKLRAFLNKKIIEQEQARAELQKTLAELY